MCMYMYSYMWRYYLHELVYMYSTSATTYVHVPMLSTWHVDNIVLVYMYLMSIRCLRLFSLESTRFGCNGLAIYWKFFFLPGGGKGATSHKWAAAISRRCPRMRVQRSAVVSFQTAWHGGQQRRTRAPVSQLFSRNSHIVTGVSQTACRNSLSYVNNMECGTGGILMVESIIAIDLSRCTCAHVTGSCRAVWTA